MAALISVALVVFFQQFNLDLRGATLETAPRHVVENEDVRDPGISNLALMAKSCVKTAYFGHEVEENGGAAHGGWLEPDELRDFVSQLDSIAISRTDRFRAAIIAGELLGAREAQQRLDTLAAEVDPMGGLASEVTWMRGWYEAHAKAKGQPVKEETVPHDVRAALIDRHGWFGELALSYGTHESNPSRFDLITGGGKLATVQIARIAWFILSLIVGGILLFIMLIYAGTGELDAHLYETSVPSSVYIETFAVWALSFAFLGAVNVLLIGQRGAWTLAVNEVLMWSLILPCFWPLLRGVSWEDFRTDMGIEGGRRFIREGFAGVVGFLAGGPVVFFVSYFADKWLSAASDDGATDAFPMFESPVDLTWGVLFLSTIGAVIWAPVVEEIVFRGALHRWLPGRLGVLGRVAITALLFGIVHPYSTAGIISVATGGVVFGLLREWRGSLIAPMVAHFLHNASISFFEVASISAID